MKGKKCHQITSKIGKLIDIHIQQPNNTIVKNIIFIFVTFFAPVEFKQIVSPHFTAKQKINVFKAVSQRGRDKTKSLCHNLHHLKKNSFDKYIILDANPNAIKINNT